MEHYEVTQIKAWLSELWPAWEVSAAMWTEWAYYLAKLDHELVATSIRAMIPELRTNFPRLGDLNKAVRITQDRRAPVKPPFKLPDPVAWIICVEANPKFPNRLGHYRPLYYKTSEPGIMRPMAVAEAVAATSVYGGRAVAVCPAAPQEIEAMSSQIRRDKGMVPFSVARLHVIRAETVETRP